MATAHLIARVVIALSVVWVALIVIGACVAAGRADEQQDRRDNRSLEQRINTGAAKRRAIERVNTREAGPRRSTR